MSDLEKALAEFRRAVLDAFKVDWPWFLALWILIAAVAVFW